MALACVTCWLIVLNKKRRDAFFFLFLDRMVLSTCSSVQWQFISHHFRNRAQMSGQSPLYAPDADCNDDNQLRALCGWKSITSHPLSLCSAIAVRACDCFAPRTVHSKYHTHRTFGDCLRAIVRERRWVLLNPTNTGARKNLGPVWVLSSLYLSLILWVSAQLSITVSFL